MDPRSQHRSAILRRLRRTLSSAQRPRIAAIAAVAAAALVAALAGCGGGSKATVTGQSATATTGDSPAPRPAPGPRSQLLVIPGRALAAGQQTALEVPFKGPWDISFDVRMAAATRLDASLGPVTFAMARGPSGSPVISSGGRTDPLSISRGWPRGQWRHVELTPARLSIDGREYPLTRRTGHRLEFSVSRGRAQIRALIVSDPADRPALLLHRLAELHARLGPGMFPIGADLADHLHNSTRSWTSGFWPGALWQAAALEPDAGMFARWALAATLRHFGAERDDTHDVGFMYEQSSLAAYRALCPSGRAPVALCSRLRRSVLSAADELMALAASNARAGTIPTNSVGPDADTIVDSMMNIAILPWATRLTGNPAYARVAERHAHRVAALLVRPDGSTIQAVNFDRATGRVVSFATHQGLSTRSTWSRGEGWALYGFAQAASELRDRSLLGVAIRVAHYVSGHLSGSAVPRWDYDAPAGAPVDVSAGVITAAGLLHLAAACKQLDRSCPAAAGWTALSGRMLAGALGFASEQPPIGFLGSQILNEHGRGCWCDGGELSFGLSYALETERSS